MRCAVLITLVGLSGGCGRYAFDPLDSASGPDSAVAGDGMGTDGGGSAGDGPAACGCIDESVFVTAGSMISQGFTAPGDRGHAGTCGGAGAPEAVLGVQVQAAGTHAIRLVQAGPTRLYVHDGCCGGTELACTTTPLTPVMVTLAAGQHIVVVADGMTVGQTALFEVDAP
jgi:hypothetical protein